MKKLLFIVLLGYSFSFGGDFVKADFEAADFESADCYKCLQSKSREECKECGECPKNDEFKNQN